jgi:hypothetical protein
VSFYLYSKFLFFSIKKKIGMSDIAMSLKMQEFYLFIFFLACQILHVFLPDISVLCALIDYVYI